MANITMCCTADCPLAEMCYRTKASPNNHWQSYCAFSWSVDGNGKPKCDFYEECKITKKDA